MAMMLIFIAMLMHSVSYYNDVFFKYAKYNAMIFFLNHISEEFR